MFSKRLFRSVLPTLWLLFLAPVTAADGPEAADFESTTPAGGRAGETPMVFTTSGGDSVDALKGVLIVPENRSDSESRDIELHYVRFPATGERPGSPIVYLAGGPGGSGIWTAQYTRRFPLFMAMREFGDVIAFDQRGTGEGHSLPRCTSSQVVATDRPTPDAEYIAMQRAALAECIDFWKSQGIDVMGYTTPESVSDLEALRRHLGAEKISLWGISYGSHLALAALKSIESSLDKVVLASVEGLDQTIKLPARTDAYFERLQDAIDVEPELRAALPDVVGLVRRVHERLDRTPLQLQLPQDDGSTREFVLHRRDLQEATGGLIADPERALQALLLYGALDQGVTEPVAAIFARYYTPGEPIGFNPMSILMDIASGIDPEREARVRAQAETALLGSMLNFSFHLNSVLPEIDLGPDFRSLPESAVPTLVLTGTLDGRTYVEAQAEATRGLSRAHQITIENAGHNLFMVSPEVTSAIQVFMRGETSIPTRIRVPMPQLPARE